MKLIVITSLYEFTKEIGAFLKSKQVLAYFEMDVQGFKVFEDNDDFSRSWFITGPPLRPTNSLGIFAFIESHKASQLMEALREFNNNHDKYDKILNAFALNVEDWV